MAEGSAKDQELFTCPVCLDLLKEPVTIPCGHSYCMGCIKDCWKKEDEKGTYSCPQCRQVFTPRPALNKNNIFSELVEQMRKTANPAASPADKYADPGQAECDVCTGKKLRAVKSCLVCLVSYCESHYQIHNLVNPGRKHRVIDATIDLKEKICSQHEKALEIFCKTDQSCICYLCTMDEHNGHKTISAAAERAEKQKQLAVTKRRFQQRIQERELELQDLRETVAILESSAQAAVADCERIFTEMIQCIERRRSEVKRLIKAQEKREVSQAYELVKQLEQEIAEVKRRDAELEQLQYTDDHIHFLQRFVSACASYTNLPNIAVNQKIGLPFDNIKESVCSLKQQVEDICEQEVIRISKEVTGIRTVLPPEPKTSDEFLLYSRHFTLDPNTAHRQLVFSAENKRVEWQRGIFHPSHPDRFQNECQVLCREDVSGRCYWEVELAGGGIAIAVSYKGRRNETFGRNDQSWCLEYNNRAYSFWHNNSQTHLQTRQAPMKHIDFFPCQTPTCHYKIGVFVDYRAGSLSFYGVSDTMTLLHRVQTTFTDTLYPGFRMLNYGTSVIIV